MNLIDRARYDTQRITSNLNNGFGVSMTLIAPGGATATVIGLHTKHWLSVDTEGNQVDSKNAHASFAEKFLKEVNYPLRNGQGEVDLSKHKLKVKDSTGVEWTYVIERSFPDETVGLIVCILGDFA